MWSCTMFQTSQKEFGKCDAGHKTRIILLTSLLKMTKFHHHLLLQLYHIAYIIIKSANSPRPGQWILERSRDYGETYEAWQYFAESESECQESFGMDSITKIVRDDDIICTSDYSNIVPLEDGEASLSSLLYGVSKNYQKIGRGGGGWGE